MAEHTFVIDVPDALALDKFMGKKLHIIARIGCSHHGDLVMVLRTTPNKDINREQFDCLLASLALLMENLVTISPYNLPDGTSEGDPFNGKH